VTRYKRYNFKFPTVSRQWRDINDASLNSRQWRNINDTTLNYRQWREINDTTLNYRQWRDIKDTILNFCRWRDINEITLNFRIDEIRYNFSDLWHVGGCLPFSSTHNTDRHDLTELLLKVPLNTNNKIRLYYCVSPSKLLQHLERKYYI